MKLWAAQRVNAVNLNSAALPCEDIGFEQACMIMDMTITRLDRPEQRKLVDDDRTLAVAMTVAVTRCRVWHLYLMVIT